MRIVTTLCCTALLWSAAFGAFAASDPANDEQKTLYALGIAISQSLGVFGLNEAELEFVKSGLTDGVLKHPSKVELKTYGPKIEQLEKTRTAALADGEKKSGASFLAKAASEPGDIKTESGAILTTIKEEAQIPRRRIRSKSITTAHSLTARSSTVPSSGVNRPPFR
jgi:FKBP-type peptidyl-prolyl cis-trans isomerase FkpA/FKBP-type peptidyl-prolyl cis-trans isomerase FklB